MCSSASVPVSRLNFGNYFSGWAGNWLKGAGIMTAPGLFHGLCAIVDILTKESANEVTTGWEDDVEVPVPCWTTIWSGGVDGWLCNGLDEMDDDDERVSLSDPSGSFLALFLLRRGNFVGSIPRFSLYNLVRGWEGMYCEVTLPWDNSYFRGDIENPWSLWIKDRTSGGSRVDLSKMFRFSAVVVVFSTSLLEIRDSKCEGEVGGDVEGDLLSEWLWIWIRSPFIVQALLLVPNMLKAQKLGLQ